MYYNYCVNIFNFYLPAKYNDNEYSTKYKKHEVQNSPLQEGVKTAAAWFGFGVILDIISRKCRFFKSPTKNSIAVNSILGLGAGIVTTFKAFSSAGK